MALTDLDLQAADDPQASSIRLALARRNPLVGGYTGPVGTVTGNAGFQLPSAINLGSVLNRGGVLPAAPIQTVPTQLATSVRSQPLQMQINSATQTRATNAAAANQSLSDFVKDLLANKPQAQQVAERDAAAVANIYGTGAGSLQQQLADINRRRQAAVNYGANSAINRAVRNNNVRRMQSGNSSYLDRVLMQQAGDIGAAAAGQAAEQERNDLQYLTGQRLSNVGRQQQIIDDALARNFMPVQAANEIEGMNLRNLGGLAGLEYGNNVYQSPEEAYMNRLNFYDLLNRRFA